MLEKENGGEPQLTDDISERTTEDLVSVFDSDESDPFSSEEFGFGKRKKFRDHRTGKRGEGKVIALKAENDMKIVVLRTDDGQEIELPLDDIER
ncbi:hypothetical protein KJ785_04470 [Patescibacteria group bacterium]|nr:hypothetical protein [Patescibacteria group bacterium]